MPTSDSWCNHVISNKSGCEDQPNKDILPNKEELPRDLQREISKDFSGHEEWLSLPFSESEITKISNEFPRGFLSFVEDFVQNDKGVFHLCTFKNLIELMFEIIFSIIYLFNILVYYLFDY